MIISRNRIEATFENGLYEKGKLWFTDANLNDLFCFDIENKTVESVCSIDDEEENGHRLFSVLVSYRDEIILIPFAAKNVYRVNVKGRTYQHCKIEEPAEEIYCDYMEESKFMSAFLCNDIIYMVGATYPAIAVYDLITNHIEYYSGWIHELSTFFNNASDKAIFRKTYMYDGKIYAPCCRANAVVVFDVNTCVYKIAKVGPSNANYSCVCFARDRFWLASRRTNACYKVSKDLESWVRLSFVEKTDCSGYRDIVVFDGQIYIIPSDCTEIYYIDLDNVINKVICPNNKVYFDSQFIINSRLCFGSKMSGYIYCVDTRHVWENWCVKLPERYKKKTEAYKRLIGMNHTSEQKMITEEYYGILLDYIKHIPDDLKIEDKSFHNKGNVIYNYMIKKKEDY